MKNLSVLCFLLGIILCVVKVFGGLSTTSWWIVTTPFWAPFAMFFAIHLVIAILIVLRNIIDVVMKALFNKDEE
jgi:uncharacterized protein (DUF983 family)